MKLVEILARDWKSWPIDVILPVSQDNEGGLYVSSIFTESGETFRLDEETDIAEDMSTAEVTRPQWQAERDRMKAMETQQATASTEPTYEQQLWDRAVLTYLQRGDCYIEQAIKNADAFMAERAKRVKGE